MAEAQDLGMKLPGLAILAVVNALAAGAAASAQEVVRTGPDGAPPAPAADPRQLPQAIDDRARGPLAGWSPEAAPAVAMGEPARCAPPPDRKPHGEVWAGIGTGGYREAGGVVTKPLGDCGSVTVAIDHLSIDSLRRH
jgi:hypothetical protein